MELVPDPAIMSKANCAKWEQYQIKHGWILVSCSGTIGNVGLVPRYWDGWAASQDVIRVVPERHFRGLIWTYLSLPMVRNLIVSKKSGSVIDHIYAEYVASLDIPLIGEQVISRLNELFDRVLGLREVSKTLHDESIAALLKANSLPRIRALPSGKGANDDPDIVSVTIDAMVGDGAYRLDAHFYNPIAQQAVANIRKCGSEVKTVGEVAKEIRMSPLFVRKYVAKEHGVPYIAGKQISQIRPEFKYISNTATEDLEQHTLHEGWTLVTCAGSVGKVGYVSGSLIGAAAQDIMRVIPDERKVDGGYLNAWLASEYGKVLIERCRYGSVVDRVSPQHIGSVLIPLALSEEQRAIGDLVRVAYEKRAEAIRLEDEAQEILMVELSKAPGPKEG